MSDYLTSKKVFDESKLMPGTAVLLFEPADFFNNSPCQRNALIKKVTPFKMTLIIGHPHYNEDTNTFEYEFEEKEYSVERFHSGRYKLKRLVPEDELKTEQK